MAFDNRQTRRMLDRLGVNLVEIPEVEEVVIRTRNKDIIVTDVSVAEIKTKGVRVFQVTGETIEEKERETPKFTEEDILLVAQQTGSSKDRATGALEESDGDLAKAILKLT